jgi:radical SAM superfamily enzyme YgiQ (UPF0313 family)
VTRTVLISDTFAFALLRARPAKTWEPCWKPYRDRGLITPEYGLLYVAAVLAEADIPFEVANLVADVWDDLAWFDVSDRQSTDPDAKRELDALVQRMWQECARKVRGADVVMVPMSYYYMVRGVKRILAELRDLNPSAVFITGGNYATIHADDLAASGLIDVVVRGEGEDTALELMDEIAQGRRPETTGLDSRGITYRRGAEVTHNPARERIADLDRLPHLYTAGDRFKIAERHQMLKALQPHGDYFIGSSFLTTRGCPEECTFCLDPAVWKRRVKFHSPAYVRKVVQFCMDNYQRSGPPNFYFGDATFALRKARLHEMLGQIADIGYRYNVQTRADSLDEETLDLMKRAGFASVALGAESFNEEILSRVVLKRQSYQRVIDTALLARKKGIKPILTFICGLPGETKESMLETVRILRAHDLREASFFPLVLFRGTALHEQWIRDKTPGQIEAARIDPDSEEFCATSEIFPTIEALTGFAEYLSVLVRQDDPLPPPAL